LTQASDDEKGRDALRKRDRAFCYIVHQEKIVLLKLIDYPHLALQIPGGTIEVNEEPADAALREAEEETGLESLKLVKLLGDDVCDMRQYGHQEIVHGWFYQFSVDGFEKGDVWHHDELHAHGGGGPIRYQLSWYSIHEMPPTHGRDALFMDQIDT